MNFGARKSWVQLFYMFGKLKKREIRTSDGFGESFLLKIIFDEGLEEWLVYKRWRRDQGGLQQPKRAGEVLTG